MFFERYYELCKSAGSSPSAIGKLLGISSSTVTQWKQGSKPRAEALESIAKHFDVSIDYLLGNTDQKEKPLSRKDKGVTDDDIKFALFSGSDNITDEMYEEVKQFAEFVKQKYKK